MRSAPIRLLAIGLLLSVASPVQPGGNQWTSLLPDSLAAVATRFIDQGKCPCRCGNYLPGSTRAPTCFGCSVGKAEVSRVAEGLAAGIPRGDVLLVLSEPVLINVFADYADAGLRETWQRVARIAAENGLHRIVLRTPARTEAARRAVAIGEFARTRGRFFDMQRVLIDHDGPWDVRTLVALVERVGLSPRAAKRYVKAADVSAQVNKDRQHAALAGIASYPTVEIENTIVENSDDALRRKIRRVLYEDSM
ncbi:MAG: hypothetical protein V3V49_04180 [Candidatus Krumholzibacteria bacterium]